MCWNEGLKLNYSDYIVFVDESGDHSLTSINSEYPVFVLCFCIVHKETYVNQIVPDIQRLKVQTFGHDQVIIHEHDIRKKQGAFSQLNKEARDQFMSDLSDSMNNVPLTIVAVVIDKIKHTNRYARPYHPYNLALKFGLERVFSFIKLQEQSRDLTHVIVEERGPREDKALELEFRRVCSGQNNTRSKMPFEIIFANKKSNSSGLQLADITARPIGLSVIRPNQPNQAFDIIKEKLFRGPQNCVEGNGLKVFP
jgi:hypothetical protein